MNQGELNNLENLVKQLNKEPLKFSYDGITDFGRFFNQQFTGYKYMDQDDCDRILNAIYKEKDDIVKIGHDLEKALASMLKVQAYIEKVQKSLDPKNGFEITGKNYYEGTCNLLKSVKAIEALIVGTMKAIITCIDC